MAVSHVKSLTVADWTGTVTVRNSADATQTVAATDLVRGTDWNSGHNQFFTLTGNTTGDTTASGTNVLLAGSGAISLGGSTGSIVVSSPLLKTYEPIPRAGNSTNSVAAGNATSSPVSLWGFVVVHPLTAGIMDLMFSASFVTVGTSSGQQSMGLAVGLYQRGAGANSTRLESITKTRIEYRVTGNNSTYSIRQQTVTSYSGYGATAETTSAGVNITSQYTGVKNIAMPINSYLSPGKYYLGLMGTNSTSSVNVGISLSYFGAVRATQASGVAPMGSLSTVYSTGSDPAAGLWGDYGQWSSAGSVTDLPASINFASLSASNLSVQPHLHFWST